MRNDFLRDIEDAKKSIGYLEGEANYYTSGDQFGINFSDLSKFIMTNCKIKEFDEMLCTRPKTEMFRYTDEIVLFYLKRLCWVGIMTLEDLLTKIEEYYDFIIYFEGKIEKATANLTQIHPGTLIYYVCDCMVFEQQSVNRIIDFWRIDGYVPTYKDPSKAFNYLLIFNQYYQTKDHTTESETSKG